MLLFLLLCAYTVYAVVARNQQLDDDAPNEEMQVKYQTVNNFFEHTYPDQIATDEIFPDASNPDQFQLAIGLVNREKAFLSKENPTFGSWKVYTRNRQEDGIVTDEEIETHECSMAELGLEGSESKFYSPDFRDTRKSLEQYANSLKCFGDSVLKIQGDSDTSSSKQIVVKFEYC